MKETEKNEFNGIDKEGMTETEDLGKKEESVDGTEPEYELDLWEGQFSLTDSTNLSNSTQSLSTSTHSEDDIRKHNSTLGESKWETDSVISCIKTTFRDISQVQQLQEQVGILADNQATNDDRYTRVKQENAALTARIHMLEEHIRELEVRSEERLGEEQRRNRELLARLEREKQLELENYAIRNNALEQEVSRLREDITESRREVERLRDERAGLQGQLIDTQRELGREKEVRRDGEEERRMEREIWEREQQAANQLIQDLSREIEDQREIVVLNHQTDSGLHSAEDVQMSGDLNSRIANMEIQIRNLKDKNTKLEENNEELQAQMLNKGLDEGRRLLDSSAANNSLAAEFEAMSENECPEALYAEIEKMRKTLKEQQDENRHLRSYIDTVLLNIMDKYPELLEIRAAK